MYKYNNEFNRYTRLVLFNFTLTFNKNDQIFHVILKNRSEVTYIIQDCYRGVKQFYTIP
jgi:hypothetical protein